jgi:hypothetical protein
MPESNGTLSTVFHGLPSIEGSFGNPVHAPGTVNPQRAGDRVSKASVAQLAEPLICNQQVVGSIPTASSIFTPRLRYMRRKEIKSIQQTQSFDASSTSSKRGMSRKAKRYGHKVLRQRLKIDSRINSVD